MRAEFHAACRHPACGRDVLGEHRPDRAVTVPVAPVERVHREQRGEHLQPLVGRDLVLAQELTVDQHRPPVRCGMLHGGRTEGCDQQVRSGLAVGVRDDLDIVGKRPVDHFEHLLAGRGRIACIAWRIATDRVVVRAIAPGGEPLRRTVDRQLRPGDPEPVQVGSAGVGPDELAVDQHIGIGRHVDLQPALCGERAQQLRHGRRSTALLRGRVAIACPEVHASPGQRLHAVGTDSAEQLRGRGVVRVLLEDPIRLVRTGAAADDTAHRIRRCGTEAHEFERPGVQHREVAGLMNDHDGQFTRDRIEVIAGRVPLLLELCVVVAEADDKPRFLDDPGVGHHPVAQPLLHRGDVAHAAIRRRQQVRRHGLQPATDHVAVRIHETGQQRAPAEVDEASVAAAGLHDLGDRAHRDDATALLCDRLGAHRGVVHRQDGSAGPDPVGHRHRGDRRRSRRADQREDDQTHLQQPCVHTATHLARRTPHREDPKYTNGK